MPFGACPSDMFSPLYCSSHSADHLIAGVSITNITFKITYTTGVAQLRQAQLLLDSALSPSARGVMLDVPSNVIFFRCRVHTRCGCGEIGIRGGLKIHWGFPRCRFESDQPHQTHNYKGWLKAWHKINASRHWVLFNCAQNCAHLPRPQTCNFVACVCDIRV